MSTIVMTSTCSPPIVVTPTKTCLSVRDASASSSSSSSSSSSNALYDSSENSNRNDAPSCILKDTRIFRRRRRSSIKNNISDRIAVMRIQEETSYKCRDYFAERDSKRRSSFSQKEQQEQQSTSNKARSPPDATCRSKMFEWCTQVVDYCKFSRETVGIALSYVDRYLSIIAASNTATFTAKTIAPLHDRKEYQLLCMAALYTAIKIHEPLEMDTKLVSQISRGTYTAADVASMEQQLLQTLGWRLSGPTSLEFVRHFVELSDALAENEQITDCKEVLVDLCRYQTELASEDYRFVTVNPSTVAASALLNAVEAVGDAVISQSERLALLEAIRRVAKINVSGNEFEQIQETLMERFAQMSGIEMATLVEGAADHQTADGGNTCKARRQSLGGADESPVSVAAHP